jgi:hypothetical protein
MRNPAGIAEAHHWAHASADAAVVNQLGYNAARPFGCNAGTSLVGLISYGTTNQQNRQKN